MLVWNGKLARFESARANVGNALWRQHRTGRGRMGRRERKEMDTRERVDQLTELVRTGKAEEAFHTFYAPDVVMQENNEPHAPRCKPR